MYLGLCICPPRRIESADSITVNLGGEIIAVDRATEKRG